MDAAETARLLLLIPSDTIVFPRELAPLCLDLDSSIAVALQTVSGSRLVGMVYGAACGEKLCDGRGPLHITPSTTGLPPFALHCCGTLCEIASMESNEEMQTLILNCRALYAISILSVTSTTPTLKGMVSIQNETVARNITRSQAAACPWPKFVCDYLSADYRPPQVDEAVIIDRADRLEWLSCESLAGRKLICKRLLEDSHRGILVCATCDAALAKRASIISINSGKGPCGVFINPHGAVHQIALLAQLLDPSSVSMHGLPTARDSWFPGHSWQIASCSGCHSHIGWRFCRDNRERVGASEPLDDEDVFFGLRLQGINERSSAVQHSPRRACLDLCKHTNK